MIRKTLTLIACAGATALFACSSAEEGEKYPAVGSFCSAYADALCQGVAAGCATSVDNCKAKAAAKCNVDSAAVGRVYRPSNADACVSKTKDLFGQKTFTADQEKEQKNLCGRVFGGTVAKNGPCQVAADCQDNKMTCDKGLCSEKTDKKLGEACNNPGDVCEKGSYCGNQGAVKFCLAKNKLGDLCLNPDNPCLEDLRCSGSCQPKYGPGEVCGTDDECKETTTAPYCDPVQNKCLPKYGLGTESCKQIGGS